MKTSRSRPWISFISASIFSSTRWHSPDILLVSSHSSFHNSSRGLFSFVNVSSDCENSGAQIMPFILLLIEINVSTWLYKSARSLVAFGAAAKVFFRDWPSLTVTSIIPIVAPTVPKTVNGSAITCWTELWQMTHHIRCLECQALSVYHRWRSRRR